VLKNYTLRYVLIASDTLEMKFIEHKNELNRSGDIDLPIIHSIVYYNFAYNTIIYYYRALKKRGIEIMNRHTSYFDTGNVQHTWTDRANVKVKYLHNKKSSIRCF